MEPSPIKSGPPSRYRERMAEKARAARAQTLKRIVTKGIIALGVVAAVAGGTWFLATRPSIPEEEITAKRGIHWHPHLSIVIRGEPQEISANIGLGAVHQPIHTHETDGVLHLEISGLVTKDDIRLSRFFEIWGRRFSRECILDACTGQEGTVKMFVNGKANQEFGEYVMQDGDEIEIRFE